MGHSSFSIGHLGHCKKLKTAPFFCPKLQKHHAVRHQPTQFSTKQQLQGSKSKINNSNSIFQECLTHLGQWKLLHHYPGRDHPILEGGNPSQWLPEPRLQCKVPSFVGASPKCSVRDELPAIPPPPVHIDGPCPLNIVAFPPLASVLELLAPQIPAKPT
ncbi:hypothetical protein Nepgr_006682 [Nepenthes gracilis]|uniref:Uncharacterized protein n=1 Tax=Nepenthes gracilis TaxID=150966 RepID=A0AAD3XHJ7_NEPGR|nr:hypothetical protein Nepgr_006682 [Nepenthes gracilis]